MAERVRPPVAGRKQKGRGPKLVAAEPERKQRPAAAIRRHPETPDRAVRRLTRRFGDEAVQQGVGTAEEGMFAVGPATAVMTAPHDVVPDEVGQPPSPERAFEPPRPYTPRVTPGRTPDTAAPAPSGEAPEAVPEAPPLSEEAAAAPEIGAGSPEESPVTPVEPVEARTSAVPGEATAAVASGDSGAAKAPLTRQQEKAPEKTGATTSDVVPPQESAEGQGAVESSETSEPAASKPDASGAKEQAVEAEREPGAAGSAAEELRLLAPERAEGDAGVAPRPAPAPATAGGGAAPTVAGITEPDVGGDPEAAAEEIEDRMDDVAEEEPDVTDVEEPGDVAEIEHPEKPEPAPASESESSEAELIASSPAPETASETETPENEPGDTTADIEAEVEEGGDEEEDVASDAVSGSGAELDSSEQQAALGSLGESVGGGGEAAVAGGGGGGAPITSLPAPPVPDVSRETPSRALSTAGGLPPVQLAAALDGVSAAVGKNVGDKREDLRTDPPQMERPSGVPAKGRASQREGGPAAAGPVRPVERAPEGEDKVTPAPKPLPSPAKAPIDTVREPQVTGGGERGEVTSAEASRVRGALRRMPTSDPALRAKAGRPPPMALTGNADPGKVDRQRAELKRRLGDAYETGRREAAQPMGEGDVYPVVPPETLVSAVPAGGAGGNGAGAVGGAAPAAAAGGALDNAVSIVAQEKRGGEITAAVKRAQTEIGARRQEHDSRVAEEKARSQEQIAAMVQDDGVEQAAERNKVQADVGAARKDWNKEQADLVDTSQSKANKAVAQGSQDVQRTRVQAESRATAHIAEGNREAEAARQQGTRDAAKAKRDGEKESEGFFGWLASKAKALFNKVKEGIKAAFAKARALVRKAITAAKNLATAAIEWGRKQIVSFIRQVGAALIAIGDVVLAKFPALRDRFRKAIKKRVAQAEAAVNALADKLKKGVQAALDKLGGALDAALGMLEKGMLAAVDVVGSVVQGAIKFAKAVVQALVAFATLIADVAASPLQWIKNLGSAVVEGIRNHLWREFKLAVREWFNQKLEAVLGLGTAVWNLLKSGGIKIAEIGKMVWEGIKAMIPRVLVQILVEKLVAMIVPAAGAVMVIIEGLQAAWGTVKRIIAAFSKFFAFLKAVKFGTAARKFAQALAAAAIAVIDFVANWLLLKLAKGAAKIGGKIRGIAQRIGRKGRLRKSKKLKVRPKKPIGAKRRRKKTEKKKEKDRRREQRKHAKIGRKVVRALKKQPAEALDYDKLRKTKIRQARALDRRYNLTIKRPARLRITFKAAAQDRKDNDLDFRVHIGPNDWDESAAVKVGVGPKPEVGLYKKLKNSKDGRHAHHDPPNQLMQWIIKSAGEAVRGMKEQNLVATHNRTYKNISQISNLKGEVNSSGDQLSAILIHQGTHKTRETTWRKYELPAKPGGELDYSRDEYRIHGTGKSKGAQELERRLKGKVIKNKSGTPAMTLTGPSLYREAKLPAGEEKTGERELILGRHFRRTVRGVAKTAVKHSHTQVVISLEKSDKDGPVDERRKAVRRLRLLRRRVWKKFIGWLDIF